jgi:hypothetical protein
MMGRKMTKKSVAKPIAPGTAIAHRIVMAHGSKQQNPVKGEKNALNQGRASPSGEEDLKRISPPALSTTHHQ